MGGVVFDWSLDSISRAFPTCQVISGTHVTVMVAIADFSPLLTYPMSYTYILRREDAEAFVEQLPIEKFHGIGLLSAAKMHELGIRTGADLKERRRAAACRPKPDACNRAFFVDLGLDIRAISFAAGLSPCQLNNFLQLKYEM